MESKINHKAIDKVILRNISAFRKPGVMTVRPGYKVTGGWVTDKPAIVATVDKKLDGLKPSDKLPAEVEDMPVDVREATGLQRLRAKDPTSYALAVAHGRQEFQEPEWAFERSLPEGKLLSKAKSPVSPSLRQVSKKPQVPYTPASQPLAAVTRSMTIIAHASPDDGLPVLKDFLAQTKFCLTVAMYDFTSAEILKAITAAIEPGDKELLMVLDHPPRNPDYNQTDEQTHDALQSADPKAKVMWALTGNDPKADEWIYPTAYHIKVAVRDSNSFWLSSGNWNVTNQPDLQANNPASGSLLNSDRDWHVVVIDSGLAQLFEEYIQHDFTVASGAQGTGNVALHRQIRDAMKAHASEQKKSSFTSKEGGFGEPSTLGMHKVFSNVPVTVQPLLTPDAGSLSTLYVDKVLALIKSAQRSVYMQTQYIHPSDKPEDENLTLLIESMSDALKRGLDVRLITSQYENTPQWLEKIKEYGLDHVLRIQNRVHNKGIVIDSKVVMVSSQNWSGDGTLRNRDAGLIIENADIAQYFEAIFIDDWTNRAESKVVDMSYQSKPSGSRKVSPTSKRRKAARH